MKLASLKQGGRDGALIVVDRMLQRFMVVSEIAPTLQYALEHWSSTAPALREIYDGLNDRQFHGIALNIKQLASPLPRAYQWLDGSAYLSHVERVRRARGAEMPPSFMHDPLMYQGGSDTFLAPQSTIPLVDEAWGCDIEAEVAIVTDDVPQSCTAQDAEQHIKLVMLVNDVSLRNLIPDELAKGFGFIHGKPPTAFSPVAVTPDELGDHWRDSKLHLPLRAHINHELLGSPNAGEDMQFNFSQLIAHAAKTRSLSAGTIIGSGTVSNRDLARGFTCLAEKRIVEKLETGEPHTSFLKYGDQICIEMLDEYGASVFGAIEQEVSPWAI